MFRYAILALAGVFVFSSVALAANLPVSRVVLSTSGMAYFEHMAKVKDSQTIKLDVRMDQINDLLKSLYLFIKTSTFFSSFKTSSLRNASFPIRAK